MKKMLKNIGIVFFLFLLLPPSIASANAGVPMIFLTFPVMIFALIPIILIEAGILKKFLKITYKKAFLSFGLANLVTTIIGFPLSWGLLLVLELLTTGGSCGPGFHNIGTSIITVIVEAAWICPWEEHLFWMVPIAFIICLIIAFLISVWIEYLIIKRIFKNFDNKKVKKIVIIANSITYGLLIVLNLVYLFFNIFNNA